MSMSLLMFFKKVNPSTCLLTMPINMNFFLCDRNHLVAIKWCFCVIESLFSWNQLMATNQSFVLWHFFFFTIKTTKWSFSCDKILLLLVTKTIWQSPCEFFTFGMEIFYFWNGIFFLVIKTMWESCWWFLFVATKTTWWPPNGWIWYWMHIEATKGFLHCVYLPCVLHKNLFKCFICWLKILIKITPIFIPLGRGEIILYIFWKY